MQLTLGNCSPFSTMGREDAMERYRHGAGVVTYPARYLRGGPLKNARLVARNGDQTWPKDPGSSALLVNQG